MNVEITLSVAVAALTTAIGAFVTAVRTLTEMRVKLAEHEKVLYSENGEVRVVSFTAHDRISADCRHSIMNDSAHVKETLAKLESLQQRREDKFIDEMQKLSTDIKYLSECVTKLSVGIKC
jgi:hypothetical protein